MLAKIVNNIEHRERLEYTVADRTQALRRSEERTLRFAQIASDWFWETDAQHRLTFLSERLPALMGRSAASLLGEPLAGLFVSEPEDNEVPTLIERPRLRIYWRNRRRSKTRKYVYERRKIASAGCHFSPTRLLLSMDVSRAISALAPTSPTASGGRWSCAGRCSRLRKPTGPRVRSWR